jgi:hypothetical protein
MYACTTHGKNEKSIKMLVEKPDRKRPHGRLRRRWEDTITKDVKETGEKLWTGLILLRIGISGGLL